MSFNLLTASQIDKSVGYSNHDSKSYLSVQDKTRSVREALQNSCGAAKAVGIASIFNDTIRVLGTSLYTSLFLLVAATNERA
jgi:hypothetical protein